MIGNLDEQRISELEMSMLNQSTCLDDPLALHEQLCAMLANHPTRLLPALERATRTFSADARYVNDPRHLKLWLAYAKHCKQPQDVFAFLAERGIAKALASFYEEWAWCVSKCMQDKQKAMEEGERILRMGIEQRAQPLERLKRSYEEFIGKCTTGPSVESHNTNNNSRPSWSRKSADMTTTSWTLDTKKEVSRYNRSLLDNGRLSFEEARAKVHSLSKAPTHPSQAGFQEDSDMDVDDLAQPVNPDDLTHISVYKDTTADARELAKVMMSVQQQAHVQQCSQKSVMTLDEGLNQSFAINESSFHIVTLKEPFKSQALAALDSQKTATPVSLGNNKFYIESALGGKTFLAVDLQAPAESQARVVLRRVKHREVAILSRANLALFPQVYKAFMFTDCAIIVTKYHEMKTLKHLMSAYDRNHQPMDNRLVLFYTRHMLSLLIGLWDSGWICNNITLDTLILCSSDLPIVDPKFKPDGSGGWGDRNLKLTSMKQALTLEANYMTPSADNPIGCELDWRAVIMCILELLHVEDQSMLSSQWRQLIQVLSSTTPNIDTLRSCLQQVDTFLSSNPTGTSSLKSLLTRQEMMLMSIS